MPRLDLPLRSMVCWLALGMTAAPLPAGKVAVWRQSSKAEFEKGKLSGVVVSADGEIVLGRQARAVADTSAELVWDLVRSPQSKLYAATGMPGAVIEFDASGSTRKIWEHAEWQALSLAPLADGSLLVGIGPTGAILRISPEGKAEPWFQTEASYVWDLAVTPEGRVYAATGPEGRVYAIEPNGEGRVFYDSPQPHVLCLALAADGELLAGTDGAGWIVSLDAQGKPRVLYDAAENEVRALAVLPDGRFVAGTAATADGDRAQSIETAAAAPKPAKNSVYLLDAQGNATQLWQDEALVYALQPSGADTLCIATGSPAAVVAVDLQGRQARELVRLDASSVLCLGQTAQGELLLGSGNSGRVDALSALHRESGELLSTVLDAKLHAQFGALDWRADQPAGTQVSVAVRSGNTSEPDDTWSAWSIEQTDPAHAKAECPPGRYLQYRLQLRTSEAESTPVVRMVSTRYQTANQAPRLDKLVVPHMEDGDGKSAVERVKLKWEATDPNGDDLTFRVAYRKLGWPSAVVLQAEHKSPEFEWDVTTVPDGNYQIELTASDRSSNAPDQAQTASLTSEPFVVDRTPPSLDVKLSNLDRAQQPQVSIVASDALCPIVTAQYSLDSGPWTNLYSEDGLFDASREEFRLTLPELAAGSHVLVVRATDAAGHTGSADLTLQIDAEAPAEVATQ